MLFLASCCWVIRNRFHTLVTSSLGLGGSSLGVDGSALARAILDMAALKSCRTPSIVSASANTHNASSIASLWHNR